jgi:glycosyltransferase involved in cell wall biosynthesis
LRESDALLSATQPRASETLDKVVYEAAACCVPVFASNVALDEFLGDLPLELRFPPRDAVRLGELLVAFEAAPQSARAETGAELRRRVVSGHSVDSWADAIVASVSGLQRR